ncbi:MAG: FG-GAP-like repeat-containing protein [Phycisphaerae bacterium]
MVFKSIRFAVLPCLLAAIVSVGCSKQEKPATPSKTPDHAAKVFTDVTLAAGIRHKHHKPILDHKLDNIMNWVSSVGAAAAAGDFNNDGWIDLYVTDSRKGTPNYLYRNNGDGTFSDVGGTAGVADVNNDGGTSMDCVWGDYDNDGWVDLYVVRWGNDLLFRNNGDGTFSDVTSRHLRRRDGSGGTDWANGNAALFLDYNLDGRLDIYVGNYFDEIDLWHLPHTRIMHEDFERARNGGVNFLYRQEDDGTFTEVAASLGVDDPGWTLAVGSADVDNDGWPDLYCADDFGPDQVFYNNRDGTFTNVSTRAIGVDTQKGMNVEFGDFNNDGWLDIYVTNITTAEYLQEGNMLWHNNGPDEKGVVTFTDISIETGVYDGGWGWGAKFLDYDNDGDLDLFAVNGFISAGEGNYWYDLASWTVLGQDAAEARNWPTIGNRSFSGYETFRFWRNDGLDSFTPQSRGVGLDSDRDGRGVACFDYDNDGDVDLFVANQDQRPHLFRNDINVTRGERARGMNPAARGSGHWLTVALDVGSSGGVNRDGIGTRVTVVTDRGLQLRERDGGNGYGGQSDPRLHFGLGPERVAKLIEVRWPDGGLQYLENVAADQIITVRRDVSQYATDAMVVVPPPPPRRVDKSTQPKRPDIDPKEIDRVLSGFEQRIRSAPTSYPMTDAYRQRCVAFDRYERAIDFFAGLAQEYPGRFVVGLNLAGAYIDKIPTCGGIAAIVSKGTLARKALDVMDELIETHGGSWVIYYARGMNHLHWPRALRHSDDAVADFTRCLRMQLAAGPPDAKEYYERIYLLLGDAHAKNKSYSDARDAWRSGLKVFPDSETLKSRLTLTDDGKLLEFIVRVRGLEKPIDTGFAFIEREP